MHLLLGLTQFRSSMSCVFNYWFYLFIHFVCPVCFFYCFSKVGDISSLAGVVFILKLGQNKMIWKLVWNSFGEKEFVKKQHSIGQSSGSMIFRIVLPIHLSDPWGMRCHSLYFLTIYFFLVWTISSLSWQSQ